MPTHTPLPVIGIIGAGKLGTTLAQLALRAGYAVYISGSGEPDAIALSVRVLAPGAYAVTTQEVIRSSDIVILALPLSKYKTLPPQFFADKLVIDAMNYWWEIDGHDEALKNPPDSSSEMVQRHLASARVVKAISHMGYHHLFDEAAPPAAARTKAIAIAGDNQSDTEEVARLVDRLGFDPLMIGPLSSGKYLEPGMPAFGANLEREALTLLIKP